MTNMIERLNEEIRRRGRVIRIFPDGDSPVRPPEAGQWMPTQEVG